ncbi:TPA: hypothetical protein ACMDOB_001643 [Vibrio metschnikovii]|uniref:hypothetical protein n=1 Tax=Vibrio TaxID=662 RepID=UPI00130242B3|nr:MULTISPECIES: hypothetical protein [Vibrio]EKO3626040.1 hypothetical protein [Vibrio metschnikovii]MDQ2109740.1 hypothetical protein [Vibrio sp. 2017_1457_15]MDQ2161914.1 hypothetical protein [Vibrio sp. 2017_1457_13]NAW61886.1 hypothetical protein [Vibrio sp. V31_P5A7T61]NAX01934.1 hypothetical protein [Vibrio sp. V34_P3A8T189]
MLSKDLSHELQAIFTQLQQQGKAPTVALVKSRLSTSLPIPVLIAAITSWKQAQRVPKVEANSVTPLTDQQRITQLEQQLAMLSTRVEQLAAELTNQKESR